jgi:hypothetical protein
MPGASSIQSFAAGCDSVTALLAFVWDAAAQGYLVKQGGTCLQVDYNAPDPQVLLPGGAPAAKVGWVTCGSTGPGAVWVPTFVETDASGAGWYQLIPNARPGVPTPCLNLNLGASQSTQMLVEYNCQGGTHTEERWAPNESFWTAPGGTGGTGGTDGGVTTTTTPINPPVGAHLLTIDVPTLIKSSSDLACLSIQENSTYAFEPQGSDTCQFFDPALVAGSPGGIILRQIENETQCLGHSGLLITLIPCVAVGAIWNDPPDADGLRFGLNLMIDGQKYCAFRQGSVFALSTQCDSVNPSFLFYDDKPSLPGSVNLQDFYDLKNKITIVKPNGEALRARVIRIAGRARSVLQYTGKVGAGYAFVATLSQTGSIGGGLKKHEVFPGLFESPGANNKSRENPLEVEMKEDDESSCKNLVVNRMTSLIESSQFDPTANGRIWEEAWVAFGLGAGSANQNTLAAAFYCWKNPGEGWRSGVAMAASGIPGTTVISEITPLGIVPFDGPIPIDPNITANNGNVIGQVDAERKILTWALTVTSPSTYGVMSLTHFGNRTTCGQCIGGISYFSTKRPLIVVNGSAGKSFWFNRLPYEIRGYQ